MVLEESNDSRIIDIIDLTTSFDNLDEELYADYFQNIVEDRLQKEEYDFITREREKKNAFELEKLHLQMEAQKPFISNKAAYIKQQSHLKNNSKLRNEKRLHVSVSELISATT
ncbi:hypothetical protein NPIL_28931 [Nephila pilipes]|uniref:Uncharacterized protein n=1 Tax=Nephila pilipes TaxID=299642 RepID=A0A8X6J4N7_NEPPI|nr:hypothetical protein NPIL_28931 [Nephila pilipes]